MKIYNDCEMGHETGQWRVRPNGTRYYVESRPDVPDVTLPRGAVLWEIYILGRFGYERTLGFAIGPRSTMEWINHNRIANIAMDIVTYHSDGG